MGHSAKLSRPPRYWRLFVSASPFGIPDQLDIHPQNPSHKPYVLCQKSAQVGPAGFGRFVHRVSGS